MSAPADRGDVKIPSVTVLIELEATPRLVISAETEADELALRRWVRQCRPDLGAFLTAVATENRERRIA